MTNKQDSSYVFSALSEIGKSGDAYASVERLFQKCGKARKGISYPDFSADLNDQIAKGMIHREGPRLYTERNWQLEERAAEMLERLPTLPPMPVAELPETIEFEGITLGSDQRNAVAMALSNRLSIILGGAGSGKTTLIRAIANEFDDPENCALLCSPTGKAAQNLSGHTGFAAQTIHSALRIFPGKETTDDVSMDSIQLLVVDEASMMTLEMLTRILEIVPESCHVVLVGDRKQLLSVGPGNVLDDLLDLGTPVSRLTGNHRQSGKAAALLHNVVGFGDLHSLQDLDFDDSFSIVETSQKLANDFVIKDAALRYLLGESVQVLAPYRKMVQELNREIRDLVNPVVDNMPCIGSDGKSGAKFRDGDRVIITKNDRYRNCCNGDVGILHIDEACEPGSFSVELHDGRNPMWIGEEMAEGLSNLELAYALTVHKAQGSEYDTILFPVLTSMMPMLTRNLFYTAISRAKKHVCLYGSKKAIDVAMHKELPPRNSMLVEKTRILSKCSA